MVCILAAQLVHLAETGAPSALRAFRLRFDGQARASRHSGAALSDVHARILRSEVSSGRFVTIAEAVTS